MWPLSFRPRARAVHARRLRRDRAHGHGVRQPRRCDAGQARARRGARQRRCAPDVSDVPAAEVAAHLFPVERRRRRRIRPSWRSGSAAGCGRGSTRSSAAGRQDEIYIVREDAEGRSFVQFGDGETGARLPSGVEERRRASTAPASARTAPIKPGATPSAERAADRLRQGLAGRHRLRRRRSGGPGEGPRGGARQSAEPRPAGQHPRLRNRDAGDPRRRRPRPRPGTCMPACPP